MTVAPSFNQLEKFDCHICGEMTSAIIANLALILLHVHFIVASRNISESLINHESLDSAIDMILNKKNDTSDHFFSVKGKLVGLSEFKVSPYGATWRQHMVQKQEVDWGHWKPASCVFLNEFGGLPITITLTKETTHGSSNQGSWSHGFNPQLARVAAGRANINLVLRNASQLVGLVVFSVPPHSLGQIWKQQLHFRQEQWWRICEKVIGGQIECGLWSETINGDFPLPGATSYGWRTMYDKLEHNSCGD